MAKLSITINKVRCIGSGDCVETAPTVFQLDADGKSDVIMRPARPMRRSFRRREHARSKRLPLSTKTPAHNYSRLRKSRRSKQWPYESIAQANS